MIYIYLRINVHNYFCLAPYSPPQNLSGVALDSVSITLSWLPPHAHLTNGILRYYHVLISDLTATQVYDTLVDGDSLQVVVSDLHPYYQYECTVTAVTIDEGPTSRVWIQTLEDSNQ